jgi:AraC family transcriptional regulator
MRRMRVRLNPFWKSPFEVLPCAEHAASHRISRFGCFQRAMRKILGRVPDIPASVAACRGARSIALRYGERTSGGGAHSMAREHAGGSYDSAVIGDRFRLGHPPTILARTSSVSPIGFTRLKSERVRHIRTKDMPTEEAFAIHVQFQPSSMDLWIDGKHRRATTNTPGATFLFDLRSETVCEIHSSFDNLRFYISQASLDELAFDQGMRTTKGLVLSAWGSQDKVLFGLANALLDQVERADERSALFIDHVALAFHAHVIEAYCNVVVPVRSNLGELSPWQLRRVLDFMVARVNGDPTIAELAQECGLSSGYFARAFRQTTGVTPHQWLVRKRVERARALLLRTALGLADVAVACGFVDQSHFTRVFAKFEGNSPGRWRRTHR